MLLVLATSEVSVSLSDKVTRRIEVPRSDCFTPEENSYRVLGISGIRMFFLSW